MATENAVMAASLADGTSVIRNAETIIGIFRQELGPDVGIALDVAFTFKLGGAIKLAQALEPYDLMWLETETFDPDRRLYGSERLESTIRQHDGDPQSTIAAVTASVRAFACRDELDDDQTMVVIRRAR